MNFKNTKDYYGAIAKVFHWAMAFVILGLILVGLYMVGLPYTPEKLEIYAFHKSFGLLILWFVGLRLIWRFITPPPRAHQNHQWWERVLAHLIHFFFYLAMIGMPLTGWLMSSAGEYPVSFFGIKMPDLVGKNPDMAQFMNNAHEILSYLLILAIFLHAVGALKHHFVDCDDTLKRMLAKPFQNMGPYILVVVLGLFIGSVVKLIVMAPKNLVQEEIQISTTVSDEEPTILQNNNEWQIIKEETTIQFSSSVYGTPFTGQFKDFDGIIIFNPQDLDNSRVDIKIHISSVDSADQNRDTQMQDVEWFDSKQYPFAQFVSTSFEIGEDGQYAVNGILTIKGQDVPIEFPFDLDIDSSSNGQRATMKAMFSLDRLSFNLGQGQWETGDSIGLSVPVMIDITAYSAPAMAE